jgi:putative two-component system response regulator
MQAEGHSAARIVIVDDEPANVRLLERILQQAGYTDLTSTTDPRDALALCKETEPDLILLDLHMPHVDGFAVMAELRPLLADDNYLPILVLTADITRDAKQRALSGGAKDFLTKPIDSIEVVLRIKNLLDTRFLHLQLQDQNVILEEKVRVRTHELEEARMEILDRLARAAEVELIGRVAPLHDVGKIGIPDAILLKADRLTVEEFEVMKTHTTIGADILAGSRFPLLQLAQEIALTHHERWDGAGYPRGLKGEAIPLAGRIVAVVDAFDAMTHDRPYRKALSTQAAWEIFWEGAGAQWDAGLVEALASTQTTVKERLMEPRSAPLGPGGALSPRVLASISPPSERTPLLLRRRRALWPPA